jgi:adenylylsulfate kinase
MSEQKATNITWHHADITPEDREKQNGHKAVVLWFTQGCRTFVLDGDNIRHGLNKNLGFSPDDRKENIRRIGEVSKLFNDAGVIALTAFISPYREDRNAARAIAGEGKFFEVYVKCSIDVCKERDPKGLYKKAIAGEIPEFTGISAPYEEPENPEIVVDTGEQTLEQSTVTVLDELRAKGVIG